MRQQYNKVYANPFRSILNKTVPAESNPLRVSINQPQDFKSTKSKDRQDVDSEDNHTFIHSDQEEINQKEARSLWGKIAGGVKRE